MPSIHTPEKLAQTYLATNMTQYPTNFVLEEDVVDDTLAANSLFNH